MSTQAPLPAPGAADNGKGKAQSQRIGWIGLGNMGSAMAANIQTHLQKHNLAPLRIFNRTVAKCAPIEALGATSCASVADLARESDLIFISTSDDATSQKIIEDILASSSETRAAGKMMIVDTTTVHPDTTKKVAARAAAQGALFAAMPVFGAAPVAQAGKLLAAFAGPEAVLAAISPLVQGVVAREILVVGTEAEKALLLKTTGNIMMASLMQIIARAHVFASKTGLPASTLERLLELNFGPVMHSDSVRMTTGVYCPGVGQAPWSDLELGIKDVGHGVGIAESVGAELAVGRLALANMQTAREWAVSEAEGKGEAAGRRLDSSGLFGVVRQKSGLEFETEQVKERDSRQ